MKIEMTTQEWQDWKMGESPIRTLRWFVVDARRAAHSLSLFGDELRGAMKLMAALSVAVREVLEERSCSE